jgi:antitoxin component YwqK of YwqJK toxin-antitoxin module
MMSYVLLLGTICSILIHAGMSQAAGERELAVLNAERQSLRRPTVTAPRDLNQRDGLTPEETEILAPLIAATEFKQTELAARDFWRAPIMKALADLYRGSQSESFDQDDEWISSFTETSPNEELDQYFDQYFDQRFGKRSDKHSNYGAENTQIRLSATPIVFLSQTGFRRLQTSEELMVASGRDLLGSVPVADFCETKPGRDLPVDFSARFSPWDFGAALASSTRLDATLMDLALQPDPFDPMDSKVAANEADDNDDFDVIDDSLDHADSDDGDELDDAPLPDDEDGWKGVLAQFEDRIKKRKLSLTEFTAKIRGQKSLSQSIRRFVIAAAVASVELQKSCKIRGGAWSEMVWDGAHALDFFACRSLKGDVLGPRLTVENGDMSEGQIAFSTRAGDVEFVGVLASGTTMLKAGMLQAGKTIGFEYLFGTGGQIRAARNFNRFNGAWFFFDQKKNLDFVQNIPFDRAHIDVSFYGDGRLRGFSHMNAASKVDYVASFYASGQPRFYLPISDGKPNGTLYWWHPSGQLAGELTYVSGKRFGDGRLIYPNGIEGFRAGYADDRPHGRMIWRDPAGNVLFSLGYVAGKAHGIMEIKQGERLVGSVRFDGGTVDGIINLRNARGVIVAEIPYKGGLLNGDVIFRDAGGMIRAKSRWVDGQADGATEAYYVSGGLASRCQFANGQLIDWSSLRPDGTPRYRGSSKDPSRGIADIDFFAGGNVSLIRCHTKEWIIDQCGSAGKTQVLAPEMRVLMGHVMDPGDLQFKPERCGGASRAMDVTDFVDQSRGHMSINYRVKELCRGADLATGLQCEVAFSGKQWSIKSCVLTDD